MQLYSHICFELRSLSHPSSSNGSICHDCFTHPEGSLSIISCISELYHNIMCHSYLSALRWTVFFWPSWQGFTGYCHVPAKVPTPRGSKCPTCGSHVVFFPGMGFSVPTVFLVPTQGFSVPRVFSHQCSGNHLWPLRLYLAFCAFDYKSCYFLTWVMLSCYFCYFFR